MEKDENKENNTLKVIATYKELDYKGNVITTQKTCEIPWYCNSEKFLYSTVCSGDASSVPKPYNGYFDTLMEKHFGIKSHDEMWRAYSVETEPVFNNFKFVFQRFSSPVQIMKWENIND